MSTTALRIELLIVGFQASIWFVLFFANFEDFIYFYKSNALMIKDSGAVIVLFALAWSYSLGAMVDGVTATIEDPKSLLKKPRGYKDSSSMRLKYPEAYKELVASDFELRLLRSTSFNLILIGFSLLFEIGVSALMVVAFFGALFVGIAWYRRKNKANSRRASLYEKAEKLSSMPHSRQ
ncbi:hypothetical protein [Kushneria konosiri]|uniref:hypothetical protein n=1 Tax=Kushneria konosiri TaxID=698828 RepID=UPI0011E4D1CE|nr:hypothetical protein [Kushneria konosiri]